MNIDIRTLAFILGLTSILQVIVIYLQYLLNKTYRGIGWWLLWSASTAAGFLCMLLRDVVPVGLISASILFTNALLLAGQIFLYIGILRFLAKQEKRGIIIAVFSVFILSTLYVLYVNKDDNARTLIFYAAAAIFLLLAAQGLFVNKARSFTASATFISAVLFIHGCFFALRTVAAIIIGPIDSVFTPTLIQTASFLVSLVAGSLCTFGLIIMVNQRSNAEMREAREQFELIFNTGPDATLITRPKDGLIVNINEGFTALTGYTRDETVGKSNLEINLWTNPADRQNVVSELGKKGFCDNYEAIFQLKDGSQIDGTISAKIITLQGVQHIISVTRDITARKRAEQALQRSEEKYRSLVENINDVFYTLDSRGNITYVSPVVERLSKYKASDLIGKPFTGFVYPDDLPGLLDSFNRLVSGQLEPWEFRIVDKDGSIIFVRTSSRPLYEDGEIVGFTALIADITGRKRAEAALKESESNYRLLAEHMTDTVWLMDMQLKTTYQSPSVQNTRGFTPQEIMEMPLEKHATPESLKVATEVFLEEIAKVEADPHYNFMRTLDLEFYRKDGTTFWSENTFSLIRDENGKPVSILGEGRDVTDRKQAQDLLLISEERYRGVVENANEIIIVAQDGLVKFANRRMEELSGYSREELLSVAFIEFIHPDDRQFLVESDFRKLSGDKFVAAHPVRLIDKGGQAIWMEISAVVIEWEGRRATLNFVSDITERRKSEEALRESEKRYRSLVENAMEAVIVIQDGLIRYANPRAFEITDYPREQVEPRPFMDFIHPDDRAMVIDRYSRRLKGEALGTVYPIRLVDNLGNVKWVQISTAVVSWQGQPATLTFMADISQNKRAERVVEIQRDLGLKLSQANDLNQALPPCLEAAIEIAGMDSGGIYLVDPDMGDLNLACSSGLSREFTDSASSFPKSSANARLILAGKPLYMQYRDLDLRVDDVRRSEGLKAVALVPVSSGKRVIACLNIASHSVEEIPQNARNAVETIVSQIGGAIDRLQAREALQESEKKFRLLIENSHDIIYTLTPDGVFTFVSPAWTTLLGHPVNQVAGHPFQPFVHPDDLPACMAWLQKVVETGQRQEGIEYRVRHIDGSWFWHTSSAVPLRDATGAIIGFEGIARDITEHKRLEVEQQRVEKLESVGVLAGGIAHDFNNILTAVLGNISLASMEAAPGSEIHESLEQAEKAALRAKDLTVQLLTFSKGGAPVKKLAALAELLKDTAGFALSGANVKCQFSLPADLWHAEVDAGQVSQAIHNLIINAQQAMPAGGSIEITAENIALSKKQSLGRGLPVKAGNYVRIAVADHGTGIPGENLEKIFDPFFTTKPKGSGLGLATAFSIARQHGGHLSVESKVGSGSTFYLYLPASTQTSVPKQAKQEQVKPVGKARILVMDDEQGVREVAGRMLNHIGYQDIEFAADGAAAIKLYKAAMKEGHPFSVAILDLTIAGGMGGEVTIKKLLKIDPGVKAIVSSGYADDPVIARHREYGFSGMVAKPYTLEQLGKAVQDVIG